tara:strand:+ start:23 stop:232 length:210 start_codon:yes stop_codon:yes gene_type:complete
MKRLALNDVLQIVRSGMEKKLVEKPIFSARIPPEKRQVLIKIWDEGRLSMRGKKENEILKSYGVTLNDQ